MSLQDIYAERVVPTYSHNAQSQGFFLIFDCFPTFFWVREVLQLVYFPAEFVGLCAFCAVPGKGVLFFRVALLSGALSSFYQVPRVC